MRAAACEGASSASLPTGRPTRSNLRPKSRKVLVATLSADIVGGCENLTSFRPTALFAQTCGGCALLCERFISGVTYLGTGAAHLSRHAAKASR